MNSNASIKVWLGKQPNSRRRRVELSVGDVQRFDGTGQNIRVLSGCAWVTVNGQDFTLKPGHVLQLPHGHYPVVISALKNAPVIYEIRR